MGPGLAGEWAFGCCLAIHCMQAEERGGPPGGDGSTGLLALQWPGPEAALPFRCCHCPAPAANRAPPAAGRCTREGRAAAWTTLPAASRRRACATGRPSRRRMCSTSLSWTSIARGQTPQVRLGGSNSPRGHMGGWSLGDSQLVPPGAEARGWRLQGRRAPAGWLAGVDSCYCPSAGAS